MRLSFPIAFLLVTQATVIDAQRTSTTRLIPYTGTVIDGSGTPITGDVDLTFELYEEQDGGRPLWREDQRVHADRHGRYLVYLGSHVDMPQVAFSEERARWLGVTVEGRALPRVMLVAVPYALRAADADTLAGQPASSFVRRRPDGRLETDAGVVAHAAVEGTGVAGQLAKWVSPDLLSSSVISESATNRVGVGLPDPTGAGVVDSVFTIRNFDNNTGFAVLNQSQARRFALNTLAAGGWVLYDGGGGSWNQGLTQQGGNVGLGTSSPDAKLKIVHGGNSDAIVSSATVSGRHAFRGIATNGSIAILGAISDNPDFNAFSNAAVLGYNDAGGAGVRGISATGTTSFSAVVGTSTTGTGVYGSSSSGLAGHFNGNVTISGTLSKGGGSFRIDHPLDPANKYLSHSFVESPDMMNIYNGNVTLDTGGEAWVTLPEWFEALNRDFRYQLTAVGAPGPNLYVASEVSGNRFKIAGGSRGSKVSWQVTGIRRDAWANAHRIPVEEENAAGERGAYLHPKEHGQPEPAETALVSGPPEPRVR